jgi:hypothetical protein
MWVPSLPHLLATTVAAGASRVGATANSKLLLARHDPRSRSSACTRWSDDISSTVIWTRPTLPLKSLPLGRTRRSPGRVVTQLAGSQAEAGDDGPLDGGLGEVS